MQVTFCTYESTFELIGKRTLCILLYLHTSIKRDMEHIRGLLREVEPDVVMLTGDILDGRPFKGRHRRSFLPVFKEVIDAIVEVKAMWSFVPGNHDYDDCPWTREDLLELYSLPGCLSAEAKTFNHTMTIGFEVVPTADNCLRMFMFDTGGNHPNHRLRYYTVQQSTIDDFARASRDGVLDFDGRTPLGTAWYHIPLKECNGLLPVVGRNGLFQCALNAGKVPFPFMLKPFRWILHLFAMDRVVGSSLIDCNFFQAMASARNIRATFFGHDHHSDAVFLKKGIFMCYGRAGAHTPPSDWQGAAGAIPFNRHGARVVEFVEGDSQSKPQLLTYIFEESSPKKQLLVLSDETAAICEQRIAAIEHARRCALGFFMATTLSCCATIALVIWVYMNVLSAEDNVFRGHENL